ncbi:MAG: PorT family protein [Ignavibacteria bacterium]|nr:MAG: PorT family protein [Ignavibacteria bacterium]
MKDYSLIHHNILFNIGLIVLMALISSKSLYAQQKLTDTSIISHFNSTGKSFDGGGLHFKSTFFRHSFPNGGYSRNKLTYYAYAENLYHVSTMSETNNNYFYSKILQDSTSNPKIKLKKGFLRPLKFIYGDSKPLNVYNFSGLSFNTEFEKTMSLYPPALREAKKALPYNAVSLGGWIALSAISLKNFISTINKSQKVSQGKLVDDSFKGSDLILVGVSAGVTIVASRLGYSKVKKAVKIFNERQDYLAGVTDLQLTEKHRRGGFKFGLNFANVSGNSVENTDSKTGITLGGFLVFQLSNLFSIQPELNISTKGYKQKQQFNTIGSENTIEYSYNLTYLEFPVLTTLSIPIQSRFKPYLSIGPVLGIKLSSGAEVNGDEVEISDFNTLDFGLAIGTGTKFDKLPLTFDIRYTYGLSSIFDSETEVYDPNTGFATMKKINIKNKVFSIIIGYSL